MSIHFGKYELVSRINIGGMAEIVKARDESAPDHPLVAVKRILPHLCEDQQYKTMFLDESRVLAQLDHEAIIKTFEIGEVDGTPYIALEFIDGQDARMLFHRSRRNDERVPVPVACYLIAKVCEGLHHAHEQTDAQGELLGLVHRDVSLQNVLLSYDGDVKITDFGIAMSSENVARTEVGIVKGKFGYMSPEQIKGAPLDRRSDVFAAGICLYELLTGERLFSGDNDYKAVERVRNVDVQPPSSLNRSIPSSLERIVMKALAKHPRDRYQSANDMRRALLAFLSESGAEDGKDALSELMRRLFADEIAGRARPDATPIPRPSSPPPAVTGPTQPLAAAAAAPAPKSTPKAQRADPTPTPVSKPAAKAASTPSVNRPAAHQPTPREQPIDPLTGLAAFDHLEKPSALNVMPDPPAPPPELMEVPAMAAPAPAPAGLPQRSRVTQRLPYGRGSAPVVPPVVPHAESIPGLPATAFLAQHHPAPAPASEIDVKAVDMDWDEDEPPTQSRGFDEIPVLPSAGDEDITRQVRIDDTFAGLQSAESGTYPPSLDTPPRPVAALPPVAIPSSFDAPSPARSRNYLPVIAVVIGIVVVIAAGLQAFGSHGVATIRFATEPKDAIVSVDGVALAGSGSPFMITELDPDTEHTISVAKPGFSQWSTRLRVRGGAVLDLPAITLEAQPGAMPERRHEPIPTPEPPAQELTAPPAHEPAHPPAPAPAPAPHAKPATEPVAKTPTPTVSHTHAPSESAPSAPAASSGSAGKSKGTLRVNTRPWSRVIIDGKPVGNTPQMNISLSVGTHKVKFVNPDFGLTKTITVNIKAGQVETQVLTLQ